MAYKVKLNNFNQGDRINTNFQGTMQVPVQQSSPNYQNGPIIGYVPGERNYLDRTEESNFFEKLGREATQMAFKAYMPTILQPTRLQSRFESSYDLDYKTEDEIVDSQYREGKIGGVVIVGFFVAASILKHIITGG